MRTKKGHMGSTIKFRSQKDRNLFMKDFNSKSQLLEIFNSWKYEDCYDTSLINFEQLIIAELIKKKIISEEIFKKYGSDLGNLHFCLKDNIKNLDESEQNLISISFYETSDTIQKMYLKFVTNIISPLFDSKIYYQVVPTFRFHFPNQKGYNWNDRYHTDIMLGHPPFEFNVWLPLTKTFDSNSMRLMPIDESILIYEICNYNFETLAENSQYDINFMKMLKLKSKSLNMDYGDFIIFDPRCLHCTQHNKTDKTRISMDIRIILENNIEKYSREYKTTGRKKMLFTPGNYFSKESV